MFKHKLHHLVPILLPLAFAACVKQSPSDIGSTPTTNPDVQNPFGMTVSESFNYQTVAPASLDITLLTNDNKALPNITVNVLDKALEDGGSVLYTAISDENGHVKGEFKLPTYMTTVVVDPSYIGLMHNAEVRLASGKISATIGGSEGYKGNIVPSNGRVAAASDIAASNGKATALAYNYMGTYTSQGKPNYLLTPNDVLSAKTLAAINASLPEQKPVPTYHPDFLKAENKTNLDIVEPADVWITFVHEGAGYLNSLAYFTYPTGHQPTSASQIDSIRIMFPNASLSGSGGALTSGNKVWLGRFAPSTSIGFCLVANGWSDATQKVGAGLFKFFSIDALNPEPTPALRRHTVMLNDAEAKLVLVGFEDQNRNGASDNDFNDLIFYATSNPYTAIATSSLANVEKPGDTDGDGVADTYDKFPTDPTRAYINVYPKADAYATIAFEDNWPNTGDYDMNDLVVDYQYTTIQNAENKTVEMFANYVCRASGAMFKNGFGVQMPFASSLVKSVTGSRVTYNSVVTIASNGVEAGQSKAVMIAFDDFYKIMPASGGNYVNTQSGATWMRPDTIRMKMTFTTALTAAQLGTAPFNQFSILNKTRGKELHLPGELPTDKMNTALFNTVQDNTNPATGKYYKTRSNLPFAINLPEKFSYPYEGKIISSAYLKFVTWAQSGGTSNADWYTNISTNRVLPLLYK